MFESFHAVVTLKKMMQPWYDQLCTHTQEKLCLGGQCGGGAGSDFRMARIMTNYEVERQAKTSAISFTIWSSLSLISGHSMHNTPMRMQRGAWYALGMECM